MRPATLTELAGRYGVSVPQPLPSAAGTWAAFQSRYDASRAALRTAEDIARVIAEAAEDDARDGCGWLEIQVDPTSYAPVFGGLEPALEAVLAGAAAAPVSVGVLVASSWQRSPAHAAVLARLASRYAGVVGFGLSNDERGADVGDFAPAFEVVRDAGLLAAPHSGFYTSAAHVRSCVELLGASRIGHGTSAAADPAVVELLASRGVALEICPTSYPPFGVHELSGIPLRTFLAAGVPVALSTDDPLLFGVGLADQYGICREALGLTDEELASIASSGIRASAAPAELKARLLAEVADWLADGAQ
ncbi:adenosine deaminase [Actinophytocola oryzae]|uniref:Adenosine deaminase n=2 Tax=Actinophytocola oryzae TaxID=502181 RepID=A0A4R7VW60_9PSEU|nr:adenosine deaminase [Actinophytocola oryzae]